MNAKKPVPATLKRTNIYLTVPQLEGLSAVSAVTGLSVAELVRRAVDKYLAAARKQKE